MVGKTHDKQSWPEMRIFIEMDSACRNQQGNCDEVENSARPFFVIFSALWLTLCNNSNQTLFSNAFTFARSIGSCWKPWPKEGRGFQQLPRDLANVNGLATMFDPYSDITLM